MLAELVVSITASSNAKRPPRRTLRRLDRLEVRCCRALGPLRHVERDLLAILQRFEAGSLDRAVMGEEILAAVIRRDESKALRVVEPLNGTCSHVVSIPKL